MNTYSKLSDAELLVLLKKKDGRAFTEIYERYWAVLFRRANGMIRNEDEAEDAVQEVFKTLLEKGSDLDIHTSLSSFLFISIRNKILKQIRHSKVMNKYLSTLDNMIDVGVESTDLELEGKEAVQRIENGLNLLPPKMREVFELSRVHQYSYRQISQKLGLADDTVKKHISRALKILRKAVDKGFSFFV